VALQGRLAAIERDPEELLPGDRDDLTALDIAEQVLPIEVRNAVSHG
jgi:hypothetical protein